MSELPPDGFVIAEGTDPAEDLLGPFYLKRAGSSCETGLLTDSRHTNKLGTVHGGVLMTFADYTLCAIGKTGSSDACVMVTSSS